MADAPIRDEPDSTLAAFADGLRPHPDTHPLLRRRLMAGAAVALLHLAFVIVLLQAMWLPIRHTKLVEQSPLLLLLLSRPPGAQRILAEPQGKVVQHAAPTAITLPIIPPPVPVETLDPALALGQALACGASSFEYLSPKAQARCKHTPWHYKYDKDGYIVLDATVRPVEPEHNPTGAEAAQHIMNTEDPCPANVDPNAPCLYRVIHGNAPP